MSVTPVVTIATPTYKREALLQQSHRMLLQQSEQNFEWLILDDSPEPSAYFTGLSDPRIRYRHHSGGKLTVGAKRNLLAEESRAGIIAHWDDDDFYAPDYLAAMLAQIGQGMDFVKLSGWFVYSAPHRALGYWDTVRVRGLHFRFSATGIAPAMFGDAEAATFARNYLGYGFSYVYRKSVWQAARFPDQDFGEDSAFADAALATGARLKHFADSQGLCVHMLRRDNMSLCFPQYLLPQFLLARLFAGLPES
jgi:glycosyltransferase involved in cell wall biosynthesis